MGLLPAMDGHSKGTVCREARDESSENWQLAEVAVRLIIGSRAIERRVVKIRGFWMMDSTLVFKTETSEDIECYVPRSRVTKHCVLNSWIGTLEFAGNRSTSQFSYRMMDDPRNTAARFFVIILETMNLKLVLASR